MPTAMPDELVLPVPAVRLVPHRAPMLLVESLVERGDDFATGNARLPENGIWVVDGLVAPEYLIELVAQTVAMANGFDSFREGRRPNDGMLVGVDDFTFPNPAPAGLQVLIQTRLVLEFGAVTVLHGEVWSEAELLAEGGIKVWEDLSGAMAAQK